MANDRERAQTTPEQVEERSLVDNIRLGGGIALVLALVLFFAQNFDDADINFLWFDSSIPLVFALLISAAVGSLTTWLFLTLRGRGARKRQEALYDSAIRGARK